MPRRTPWLLLLAAAVLGCADAVSVGSAPNQHGLEATRALVQFADDVRGEWYLVLRDDALDGSLSLVATLGEGAGPQGLSFSVDCVASSSCPLPLLAHVAALLGTISSDAAVSEAALPSGDLQLLTLVGNDAATDVRAVLFVAGRAIPLQLSLSGDRTSLRVAGPAEQAYEFHR